MIYAGHILFNDAPNQAHKIESVLESYISTSPAVVRKNSLIFYYGKLSNVEDMDDVWENESSLLVGRVFDKKNTSSFKKTTFMSRSHLSKTALLQQIWGKYVYIGIDKNASQFDIVVDSTGQLPFFYYTFPDGNVLFSSDIEIIFKVLGQKPEYNWTYLCSYLIYGNSSAIQTPFQNIYELPPACCLKITKDDRKTSPFWNPLVNSSPLGRNAVGVLEATLKPWIEPYKNICVSLSGGLDSSALVYCLNSIKRKDQNLSAMNYFHPLVKSSNELIHARKVCKETGIELIEFDASQSLPFDAPNKKQPLNPNKPIPGLVSLGWLDTVSKHILSSGSCIFMSGHGSDHIFMCPPSKKSVSDYILEKGFKGSIAQLKNITTFYRDPLFTILKENVTSLGSYFFSRRLDKRHPKNTIHETPEWIKQALHQKKSTDFIHPVYETLSTKILPGKYEQIDAFYDGLASIHAGIDRVSPINYPFLYEPVVEFALSLSTYTLFDKGYDRYPVRKAVSDRFKTETVWRQDKSQTTGVLQLGVKKNLEHVLNICLNGQFVKQNLIDREGLHNTIMRISNGDNKYMWFFIHLASTEIFLKYWEEKYW